MPAAKPLSVDALNALREEGLTQEQIAERFGVSQSKVSTTFAANRDQPGTRNSDGLEDLLVTLTLDARGQQNAATARSLARMLDRAEASATAGALQAAPAIAKELRSVVEAIMEVTQDDKDWLTDLFAPVVDTTD